MYLLSSMAILGIYMYFPKGDLLILPGLSTQVFKQTSWRLLGGFACFLKYIRPQKTGIEDVLYLFFFVILIGIHVYVLIYDYIYVLIIYVYYIIISYLYITPHRRFHQLERIDSVDSWWITPNLQSGAKKNHHLRERVPCWHICTQKKKRPGQSYSRWHLLQKQPSSKLWALLKKTIEPRKNPPTFHYTGWLIGILIMIYYDPYITG